MQLTNKRVRATIPATLIATTLAVLAPVAARAGVPFVRGDANASGEMDISDGIRTLQALFFGITIPCDDAADTNDDGVLDISDAIRAFTFLFIGGPPPEPPYPGCGEDPTADPLDCADFPTRECTELAPTIRELIDPAVEPCIGEPRGIFPNTLQPGDDLRRVTILAPDAVCNDGTPGVMYVRAAPPGSPRADSWVIQLQGGSGCAGFKSCLERWCGEAGPSSYNASRMSSLYCPPSMAGTGIFFQGGGAGYMEDVVNSFRDYNHVFLYYCSSDSWRGRNSRAVLSSPEDPGQRYTVAFRGRTIFEDAVRLLMEGAVPDELGPDGRPPVPLPPLSDADLVILSGSSAGAAGVRHNADWFASLFDPSQTDVRLLVDAGASGDPTQHPRPELAGDTAADLDEKAQMQYERDLVVYDPFLDESCVAHLGGTDELWRCSQLGYLERNHITTPYFTRLDLNDGVLHGTWEAVGVARPIYSAINRATLLALPTLFAAGVEAGAIPRPPGVYGPNCGNHVGVTSDTLFHLATTTDAGGMHVTFHDALVAWLRGEQVNIVDTIPSTRTMCDPPPPENIRDVLGECGDGFPDGPTIREGEELRRVTLSHPEAICNDGTPAVLYVRPAVVGSTAENRWVIFFQGGSGCDDFESCEERWCGVAQDASRMSSRDAPETIGATGIFRRTGDPGSGEIGSGSGFANAFADYNQVYLYYCSSDSWNGRATDSVLTDPEDTSRRYSIHFRGHSIVAEVIRALLPGGLQSDPSEEHGQVILPALKDAELVLVTGFSAGSDGVLHNGDWIASQLAPNGTQVRLVRGAGFLPRLDLHPSPNATVIGTAATAIRFHATQTRSNVHTQTVQSSFLDASARAALEGTADDWRLADNSYVTLNHVTTPFFLETDLLDRTGLGQYARLGIAPGDFAVMMRRTLLSMQDLPTTAAEGGAIPRVPGVMGTSCADHFGFVDDVVFFERTVEDDGGVPRSVHDAIDAWVRGLDVSVVDDSSNPTTECGTPSLE